MHDVFTSQRQIGIFVFSVDQSNVCMMEFNEFLRRIAAGAVRETDMIFSEMYTYGQRKKVSELRVFQLIRAGKLSTERLVLQSETGVLAEGVVARELLQLRENRLSMSVPFSTEFCSDVPVPFTIPPTM